MCTCVNACVKNTTNSYNCADIWIVSGIPFENKIYLYSLQL